MQFKIKKDTFKSQRGRTRVLDLSCRKCNSHIAVYQKDGPGNLRRLYFDRIFDPKELVDTLKGNVKEVPNLQCSCGEVLGIPYVYQKENRKAFRIFQDALVKKTITK